jgi:hypothetical protein
MKRQTNCCLNPSSEPQPAATYSQTCTVPKTRVVLANISTEVHRLIVPVIVPISETTAMILDINNNSLSPLVEGKRAKRVAAQLPYFPIQYNISTQHQVISALLWPSLVTTQPSSARATGRIVRVVRSVVLAAP